MAITTSKKNSLTITLPNPIQTFGEMFDTVAATTKERMHELYMSFVSLSRQERLSGNKLSSLSMPKFNKKKVMQYAVPVILVVLLAFIVFILIKKISSTPSVKGVATSNLTGVKTTQINRDFQFPLKDNSGKSMGNFTYTVLSAEERHQIVVKGQNATSVPGRIFLIVNLKLNNTLNQGLQINTRDYIRISVNNDTKQWFAPDIHNDPVEAQAISTTDTRVGLAINDTDRDIKLQIGEISGKKTIIPVEFKN